VCVYTYVQVLVDFAAAVACGSFSCHPQASDSFHVYGTGLPSLPFPSHPIPSLPFPSLPFPVQEIRSLLVQEFKKLWTEMKRITSDSNLSDGRKKTLRDVQLQRLYCATGEAKIKGAVEQIEAALAEGGSPSRMQGHMAFSSLMRSNESQHCT